MRKIGLAIALGADSNSHTQTFIDAINYSLENFPDFKNSKIKIVNDQKSAQGGKRAAEDLVDWGANVIVGHFSSIAALSALPIYTNSSIPLILPASTACELNSYSKRDELSVIRYQKNNDSLMEHSIHDGISHAQGNVYVIVQDNSYGKRMAESIPLFTNAITLNDVPSEVDTNGTYIIVGYSDFASRIMKRLTQTKVYRVMLVDDSDSKDVRNSLSIKPTKLSSIRSTTPLVNHGTERPYWNETLLALSLSCVVDNAVHQDHPNLIFDTYLGLQEFDSEKTFLRSNLVSYDY